jgi:ParB-like chromosome segregation protein Spo0J
MKKDFMAGMKKTVADLKPPVFSEIEKIKKQIIVREELKSFIPALSNDEFTQLEQNIVQYGCKDPIIVWSTIKVNIEPNTDTPDEPIYILVDGHNRYAICQKHGIDFKISLIELPDIEKIKDFMIEHQLGRRNLTTEQMAYFRGLRYNREKTSKGKYDRVGEKVDIAEKLAAELKVSPRTIKNDSNFALGIEKLPDAIKKEVLQGQSGLNKEEIQKLGKENIEISENESEAEIKTKLIDEVFLTFDNTLNSKKTELAKQLKSIRTKKDCDSLIDALRDFKKLL